MNTKKQLRLAGLMIGLGAFVGPLAVAGTGCDGENPLGGLCCSDFKPGTNMLTVDWGIDDPVVNARFGVAIQAIGDFSGTATAMVSDLGTLCQNLAIELGASPDAVTSADPGEFTSQWCTQAATQISAISANITVAYQPAQCSMSLNVQAGCEANCDVSGSCDPGTVEARCTGGEVSVKCEGTCSGSCEGSANVAVTCEGTCSGECAGECEGTQNGGQCEGVCRGECRGSCELEAGAQVECEGECQGSCEGTATAPKCTGTLEPPSCDIDADCQASCEASASAKAECTPPAVTIEGGAEFKLQIAALKKYLPEIITIGEARADLLLGQAEAMVTVSGNLDAALEGDGKAVFCIVPAATAIADALANIEVSASASASVLATIK